MKGKKIIRIASFVVLALALGFFGLSLLFSDLSPQETIVSRTLLTTLFFFLSGLVIGYFNPDLWLLAGITGWGGLLLSAAGLLQAPAYLLELAVVLFSSLGASFLGGYAGAMVAKKKLIDRIANWIAGFFKGSP